MDSIPESEFIINKDGSIYHLGLKPGDLAHKIITVGDQHRVDVVAKYFDKILLNKQTREFKTVTGEFADQPLSIISTGIGTDNIDIVLNEIDALFNINFSTKVVNPALTSLKIMRLGTSGSIQSSVPIDSVVISQRAIGLEGLMHLYDYKEEEEESNFSKAVNIVGPNGLKAKTTSSNSELLSLFAQRFKVVNTLTATGFYAPQGRQLRIAPFDGSLLHSISQLDINGQHIHNLEMETSGIYGLAKLLGHQAISISAILANRIDQTFSKKPKKTVDEMIKAALELWVSC